MAPTEIALRNRPRAFGEQPERETELLGEHDGKPERREQGQQQRQRERQGVQLLQRNPGIRNLLIVAISGLYLLGVLLQLLRHRLDNLKHAQGLLGVGAVDGHDDAQQQSLIRRLLDGGERLLQSRTPQCLRRRRLRRGRRSGDAADREHAAGGGKKRCLVDAGLLAGPVEI